MPDNDDQHMAMRKRRALYRAQHRGTREMDFLMGRFAEQRLADMDAAQLSVFEEVMEIPDPVLTGALVDGVGEFEPEHAAFIKTIRQFHKNKAWKVPAAQR